MTLPPEGISPQAWDEALQIVSAALRDDRCGTAVRFCMTGQTLLSFRETIARALDVQRPVMIPIIGRIGA